MVYFSFDTNLFKGSICILRENMLIAPENKYVPPGTPYIPYDQIFSISVPAE